MSARTTKGLLVFAATLAAAYALRGSLIRILTKSTGTWVGAPND